jgi:hypothetical protein
MGVGVAGRRRRGRQLGGGRGGCRRAFAGGGVGDQQAGSHQHAADKSGNQYLGPKRKLPEALHESGLVRPTSGIADLRGIRFAGRVDITHLGVLRYRREQHPMHPGDMGPPARMTIARRSSPASFARRTAVAGDGRERTGLLMFSESRLPDWNAPCRDPSGRTAGRGRRRPPGCVMAPDRVAGVLVWEKLWAVPFASEARRAGGRLIASGCAFLSRPFSPHSRPTNRPKNLDMPLRPARMARRGAIGASGARTAAVVGTAAAVSHRIDRREDRRDRRDDRRDRR